MTKATEALYNLRDHLESSPASVFELSLEVLEEAYQGQIDIVDATHPAMAILATTAVINAGSIMRAESLSRREFAILAQSWEDLFPHMSTEDHLDRFARPCEDTRINLAFSAEEFRNAALMDTESGMKRITLPRDTNFTVSDLGFYFGYPIDIYIMDDGQFVARWDDSIENPIRELATNHIETRTIYTPDGEVLVLQIPCIQLRVKSHTQALSAAGYSVDIGFVDQFYAARVYTKVVDSWVELKTTFDEQVYDPSTPTVVVKVEGNRLSLKLPEVYLTTNNIGTSVRVDVFTTKGKLSVDLSEFDASVWKGEFVDFGNESNIFVDPVKELNTRAVSSLDTTFGGNNGLSFEQLKHRVVYGKLEKDKPMSFEELKEKLAKEGLGVERQKDMLGIRTFVATRKLEIPSKEGLSTGTGTASVNVEINLARDDVNNHIVKNGEISTIKPNSLFIKYMNTIRLLSDQETMSFNNLNVYDKADFLNNESYFYTPYHYIIDETASVNALRAYYLAKPTVQTVNTLNQNASSGFTISTSDHDLSYDEETQKYTFIVRAETPNFGERTIAVLNYTDPITGEQWDLMGERTIVDSSYTEFKFVFKNNIDIDAKNTMGISDWSGTGTPRFNLADQSLDLVYLNTSGSQTTSFDSVLAKNALTGTFTAITHERIDFVFGTHLDALYTPMRKVLTPPTYKKWGYDVPDIWDYTKYEEGIEGKVMIPRPDGGFDFKTEFNQGDPVIIDGEPVMLHNKGDFVLDSDDNAIEETPAGVAFECRLSLIDAVYRYGNTREVTNFADDIPLSIQRVLRGTIARSRKALIDQTDLFFEPVSDKVDALATLEAGRIASINTALAFKVRIRLTKSAYETPAIRTRIRKSLISIILEELENREFYMSRLYGRLTKLSPENIRDIEIDSPIPNANMAILNEENASFTLATKALVLSNGQMDVVDDVDIEWTL